MRHLRILAFQTHQVLFYDLCQAWREHEVFLPVPEDFRQISNSEADRARSADSGLSGVLSVARDQLAWLRSPPPNLHYLPIPGIRENDLLVAPDFYEYFRNMFRIYSRSLSGRTLEDFDVVYFMHWHDGLCELLTKTRRPLVLHYGGQAFRSSIEYLEKAGLLCDGRVHVVSYSEQERARFAHHRDKVRVIPFGKDPETFKDHRGDIDSVLVVNNNIYTRSECSPWLLPEAVADLSHRLFGVGNPDVPCLPYDDLVEAYRAHRVFLHLGVREVPYTLALVEALMSGIPVVSLRYGDVDRIIDDGVSGLIGGCGTDLNHALRLVLEDQSLGRRLGENGRVRAQQLFGLDVVTDAWNGLFEEVVGNVC